ncbi:hypothetical protein J2741_002421 [Methanolinea mesophila]|uniref:DUF1848 domain-containing protein n=1 Tax=Methanolinea mesophila TaxID=547055 RepID=UPI001AE17231|nr:DUF1848 domain-containing protein [Methanolinea mesophila]MBP1929825.1 hypothetical protein [Methanolinea mesophila]
MAWRKGWERVKIKAPGGILSRDAVAPVIVSASRSTDIPAFYGNWFAERLRKGYAARVNPFSGKTEYVSFQKTRLIVFWTKNPAPFFEYLPDLDAGGFSYLFQYTLNDYEKERLEPGVPDMEERIASFTELADRIGKGRMVWRYDPILLSRSIDAEEILVRIGDAGDALRGATGRMIISFIDIARYPRVRRNLASAGFADVREPAADEIETLCRGLAELNQRWNFTISACGEPWDCTRFGIAGGSCINYHQIISEFPHDSPLMDFLSAPVTEKGLIRGLRALKDPGQRSSCGCIVAKDIGQYSTCPHLCTYCYANASPSAVARNITRIRAQGQDTESILGRSRE